MDSFIRLSLVVVYLVICLPPHWCACPIDQWPQEKLPLGEYSFEESEEGLAWNLKGEVSGIKLENGKAVISTSKKHAYMDLNFGAAGMPDARRAALAATIDLSQLQLPQVPASPKWNPDVRDNGFELLKMHGLPDNGRVVSLVPYRKADGLAMMFTHNSEEGHIKAEDKPFAVPNDGQPHEYVIGFPMKGKDGDGDVFVCVDGELKFQAALADLKLTTTDVTVVRLGFVAWGDNVGGSLLIDKVLMYVPPLPDVYVDEKTGADTNDGATPDTALASVVRAAEVARPGTTVHIAEGIYRGALELRSDGRAGQPIKFVGKCSDKTAIVGSIRADSLTWTQHKDKIYKADRDEAERRVGLCGHLEPREGPPLRVQVQSAGRLY
ncbi:unnamed protein product [Vitrella brassicaformis CCMP3155]|uniref:DUF1565 domain-containing protein n=2 Tax=Vitrella brassicaformis TaxID=1169539 RepID=A0A0G4GV02_VITBC|nr:unnamed protein product [Vitrella brassicaformis CCMP3155]|eukprot:CEM34700.1 unnamed protein product [Vitrella brassicaformis CCMP3155]